MKTVILFTILTVLFKGAEPFVLRTPSFQPTYDYNNPFNSAFGNFDYDEDSDDSELNADSSDEDDLNNGFSNTDYNSSEDSDDSYANYRELDNSDDEFYDDDEPNVNESDEDENADLDNDDSYADSESDNNEDESYSDDEFDEIEDENQEDDESDDSHNSTGIGSFNYSFQNVSVTNCRNVMANLVNGKLYVNEKAITDVKSNDKIEINDNKVYKNGKYIRTIPG